MKNDNPEVQATEAEWMHPDKGHLLFAITQTYGNGEKQTMYLTELQAEKVAAIASERPRR